LEKVSKDPLTVPNCPTGVYATGRISASHIAELGASSEVLSWITSGVEINLNKSFRLRYKGNDRSVRENQGYMTSLLQELIKQGVIERCETRPPILWRLKLVPKTSGDPRLVVDMGPGRGETKPRYFEGSRGLERLCRRGCWFTKFDWRNGYWHLRYTYGTSRWHGCSVGNAWYRWLVLIFGVSPAPAIFCRLTDVFRDFFRSLGIRCASHVDDFVFVWSSWEEAVVGTEFVRKTFEDCGVLLNMEKSILVPHKTVEYLGLEWNGEMGTVGIPPTLREKLIRETVFPFDKTLKEWARILGIAGTWSRVFSGAYALLAPLSRFQWIVKERGWNKRYSYPGINRIIGELMRSHWRNWHTETVSEVYADSSSSGGGWCDENEGYAFPWIGKAFSCHINRKETLCLLWSCIWKARAGQSFRAFSDNTTAVSRLKKGFCLSDPDLNTRLLQWSREKHYRGLTVEYHLLPSQQNPADSISRIF